MSTVAILAQGTNWADAVTQAYIIVDLNPIIMNDDTTCACVLRTHNCVRVAFGE